MQHTITWIDPKILMPPPDHGVLVIWKAGSMPATVEMALWCSEVGNWQEYPDGDFANEPEEIKAWGDPSELLF